jgi:hypothetical protein
MKEHMVRLRGDAPRTAATSAKKRPVIDEHRWEVPRKLLEGISNAEQRAVEDQGCIGNAFRERERGPSLCRTQSAYC